MLNLYLKINLCKKGGGVLAVLLDVANSFM